MHAVRLNVEDHLTRSHEPCDTIRFSLQNATQNNLIKSTVKTEAARFQPALYTETTKQEKLILVPIRCPT